MLFHMSDNSSKGKGQQPEVTGANVVLKDIAKASSYQHVNEIDVKSAFVVPDCWQTLNDQGLKQRPTTLLKKAFGEISFRFDFQGCQDWQSFKTFTTVPTGCLKLNHSFYSINYHVS